jgi:hypothetical protein
MTFFTAPSIVEFNAPVGVRQTGAYTYRSSRGAVWENAPLDPWNFHKGALATGPDLVFFIVTGADFVLFVTPDG